MTDRDRDLIIDLMDDRLSQADAEAALARIKGDPELAAEYERQVTVKTMLASEPVAQMTPTERSTLRESLTSQLSLDEAPAAAPIRTTKKRSWWQPALGLAAAAAAVTAIVIIPGTFGSSSDGGSDSALTAITVAETFTAAELAPENGTDQGNEADASGGVEEPVSVPEVKGVDIPDVLSATAGDKTPEEVSEDVAPLGYQRSLTVDREDIDRCLELLREKLPPETTGAILLGAESSGTSMIVHLGLTFADGIQAGVSIDLADCSVVTFDL
jgi:hypothetical protein